MNDTMFRLDGKIALVTGSATGLGAATAICLAGSGADVVVSDRPGENIDDTAASVGKHKHRVYKIPIDVCSLDQIREGVAAVESEFGHIDILVNNAGINLPEPGLEVTEENWDRQFAVNVKGGFFMAQVVAKSMVSRSWGRIIFMASQAGLVGIPGQPVYCSSKGAVVQLVRTLCVEWAKYGITVNAVAPTFVETALTRKRFQDAEYRKFVLERIPAGKLAAPEDVAAAVTYLASEEAGMVNGSVLSVDGGWTAW